MTHRGSPGPPGKRPQCPQGAADTRLRHGPAVHPPAPGGPRRTPWHLSGETGFSAPYRSNCQSCVPRGRQGLYQLSIVDVCFTASGAGEGVEVVAAPAHHLGFLTSSAALQKKKKHKRGQLLKSAQRSAPEGG